jgi:hypothetical protein
MGLFDDLTKTPMSTVLLGLGVAMVAPTVLPSLATGLRPLAKSLVKGGVALYDAAKEGIAEAGEQLNDIVAESRAELAREDRDTEQMAAAAGVESPNRTSRKRSRT